MVKDLTKLWEFQHAPSTINDMVLNPVVKTELQKVIEEKPNVILFGKHGVGKGTFFKIFIKETEAEYLRINASLHTGIDTIRDKVHSFAKAANFTGDLKFVFLDEVERLSPNSQESLTSLIEEVEGVTRFICACNRLNKFVPEFKDRFRIIEFIPPEEKEVAKYLYGIVQKEGIKVEDAKVLMEITRKGFPSIRQCVKLLQGSCNNGKLSKFREDFVSNTNKKILESMKKKDLQSIREIFRNHNVDTVDLYEYLFENISEFSSPGDMIIEIGEALWKDKDHAIPEINFVYFVTRAMKNGFI